MSYILDWIFEILIRASWYAFFVFPVAWLLCHMLRQVPRKIHCWIWRVAYFKIIVGAIWIAPVMLPILPVGNTNISPVIENAQIADGDLENTAATQTVLPSSTDSIGSQFKWTYLLVGVWSIGFLFFLTRTFREWMHSTKIRQQGTICESGPVFELFQQSVTAMGIQNQPRLFKSDHSDVPALIGIFRPIVVVPTDLIQRSHPRELSLVFRHEIGHLKRMDLIWNLLPRIVAVTLYFHPLTWIANRRWQISQELACDELVLQSPDANRKTYANALVQVAEFMRRDHRNAGLSAVGAVSSFRSLRERIITMQTLTRWSRFKLALIACCLVVVSIAVIIPWQLTAQKMPNASVAFINGGFESGDTSGWKITPGPNAQYVFDDVIPFDMDGSGGGAESNAFALSVGQIKHENKKYRHVDITQELYLEKGKTYEFSFDWAVENFYPIDNYDGGVFQLVVDGQILDSFDTENIWTKSVERGTLKSSFTPVQSGVYSVGARINRRYPIPFPNAQDPTLLQYLDNFSVQETAVADFKSEPE